MQTDQPNPTLIALRRICAEFDDSLETLAQDIWTIAEYIENEGNRGFSVAVLKSNDVPTHFLQSRYDPAYKGILFFSNDEYYGGFMVRKNPHWKAVWIERFGHLERLHPDIVSAVAAYRTEAEQARLKAEAAAALPKREHETFALGKYADFSTYEIGLLAASAELMSWQQNQRMVRRNFIRRSPAGLFCNVFANISNDLEGELRFRRDHERDLDAATILKDSTVYYFTQEQRVEIAAGRLAVDDAQPLNPPPFVPQVVHVKSRRWYDVPEDERVYIGRNQQGLKDTGWGNPYAVAKHGREKAIEMAKADLLKDPTLPQRLDTLRGKRVIGCWCKAKSDGYPNEACHGDVIVELMKLNDEELRQLMAATQEVSA